MNKIIEIINEIKPGFTVNENTNLFDENILDSLAMISLVSELDDEFDIEISARDIVPENFKTVADIYKLVQNLEEDE